MVFGRSVLFLEERGNPRDFGSLTPTNRDSLGSTGIKIRTRVTWGRVRLFEWKRVLCGRWRVNHGY